MCGHVYCLIIFLLSAVGMTSARLVDLSHVVKEGSSRFPTQRPFSMNVTFNGTTENGYWYQSETVCAGTHFATHMDAPCHFSRGSWCVADLPLDHLFGRPGVCIHVQNKVGRNGDYQLETRELLNWEDNNGPIPKGAVVLVHTGWSRFWKDETSYRGTADPSPSQHHFPGVSANAAQWLADQRQVVGVGIDTLSIDYGQTRFYESHVLLGRRNIFILENLHNLEDLPAVGFTVHAMAIKLDKASGAPARVVAVVNGGMRLATAGMTFTSLAVGVVLLVFIGNRILNA